MSLIPEVCSEPVQGSPIWSIDGTPRFHKVYDDSDGGPEAARDDT